MDMLWSGFRRSPNKGDMTLFRKLSPRLLELAKRMYGEDRVGTVRFGQIKETAYILVILVKEPAGAEGPASDAIMELNARFYGVLMDGQAGEAEAIDQCHHRRRRYHLHSQAQRREGQEGGENDEVYGEEYEDKDEAADRRAEQQQQGKSLVELFEIQVQHPISGRLLVGPVDKQKTFTRS
ncbi:uncharacterized protein PG998_003626 [Apiospora kogelbergensis]|uniref:Uncharacterized protein n=1 Tax=Apiospora kogelbergensis TaxID=1337665 RepID=A0AAW0QKU3_9PEZI